MATITDSSNVVRLAGTIEGVDIGLASIKAEGQAAIVGAAVLAAGSGIALVQAGQEIEIAGVTDTTGWVDDTGEVWTFGSFVAGPPAFGTFTVPGDQTAKYSEGTRIRLTQTTVKYFVVAGSSHAAGTTTVTITGGTDYTLANAAISAHAHSYAANPTGYPGSFAFNPGSTGFSSTTVDVGRFWAIGKQATVQVRVSGTSNATTFTFSLPLGRPTGKEGPQYLVPVTDNGAFQASPGNFSLSGGPPSLTGNLGKTGWTAGGFTGSGTKGVQGLTVVYEFGIT